MTFDHEKWKNALAGIQSLAVTIAVIVGGIWSLYTFDVLGARDRASAELRELQYTLDQQATVQIEMEAEQIYLPGDTERYVLIEVTIQNTGNRNTILNFSKLPLGVARVRNPGQNPVSIVGPRMRYGVPIVPVIGWPGPPDNEPSGRGESGNRGIYRGETWSQEFLIRVAESGVYLITFAVDAIGLEAEKRVALQPEDLPKEYPFVWSSTIFAFVE